MVVQNNFQAYNASRQLGIITGSRGKTAEKLSSGYRINRAGDDAAGLSISEKMRFQVRGLNRASLNASDGISLIQTAEGALGEVHSILDRMKELSVQAANDTNTSIDRNAVQKEIDSLTSEINRIASTTQFNTMNLLDGSLSGSDTDMKAAPAERAQTADGLVTFELKKSDGTKYASVDGSEGIGQNTFTTEEQALANFCKDAASFAVGKLLSAYTKLRDNAASNSENVGLALTNIDGSGGTLARAELELSSSSASTSLTYTMRIDTSDYSSGSLTDAKKADLAATIAHEMTHIMMYDTLTNGMVIDKYPSWFIEGTAQTSSGDSGWVSNHLTPSSSEADIKSYMANSAYRDYGAGYIATLYLAYKANGDDTAAVNAQNLQRGLDTVFGELSSGKTLNEVIANHTDYNGVSDFEYNVFRSADADTIDFTKKLLQARGANGQGSLLAGDLSKTKTEAFGSPTNSGSGYYQIDTRYSKVKNVFNGADGIDTSGGSGTDPGGSVTGRGGLHLQVGALSGQAVTVTIDAMNATAIGVGNLSVLSFDEAGSANESIETAIDLVSSQRAYLGAMQNRLEHTILNLDTAGENTSAAESRIRDADYAKEMVEFSKVNTLAQAGQAMLAQANQSTQGVLTLLQ